MPSPESEVSITAELVSALVSTQFPELAGEVVFVAHGWDNDLYRVGEAHVARLPRREIAVPLVANEQHWLALIAPSLPVPVPAAVAIGVPGAGYPWPWSILPWFDGLPADRVEPHQRDRFAPQLAEVLVALHIPSPADAPTNDYRGGPLGGQDAKVHRYLEGNEHAEVLGAIWSDALAAPPAPTSTWAHGDLHPANILLDAHGQISALIDFGDMSGGDPAVDLAAAWLLFSSEGRARFREAVDAAGSYDAGAWRRARGWAISFSVGLMNDSDGTGRMVNLGRRGLSELVAG